MRRIANVVVLAAMVVLLTTTASWAQVTPYSQDFELLVQADPAALSDDGWLIFGNVFDLAGNYIGGYGVFPAPNGGPGFSAIAAGEGGATQGAQQLVVYSDYNNIEHQNPDRVIEANVFQEQTIQAGDVGLTVLFSFDAKLGDLVAPSTALAFIKTIDPNNGFATTNFITVDTTGIPATWLPYSIQLVIDPTLIGQILQFGFSASSSEYTASGVFYDNINQPVPVELMSFSVE